MQTLLFLLPHFTISHLSMTFFNRIKCIIKKRGPINKTMDIYSPVDGESIYLDKVPDPIFSEKILGDGIAINPHDHLICAPLAGTIAIMFEHSHAFTIESPWGIELLVHIGIDTVEQNGKGFTRLLEQGAKVNVGDPIIDIDLTYLKNKTKSLLIPVVIANSDDMKSITPKIGKVIAGKTPVITVDL